MVLIAITTALDESEGEGPRALCPTQRVAGRSTSGKPVASPRRRSRPSQTTFRRSVASLGTPEVLGVYDRMAQVGHIICTAFRGPDQSPPLPEHFASHLEWLETDATRIDESSARGTARAPSLRTWST